MNGCIQKSAKVNGDPTKQVDTGNGFFDESGQKTEFTAEYVSLWESLRPWIPLISLGIALFTLIITASK